MKGYWALMIVFACGAPSAALAFPDLFNGSGVAVSDIGAKAAGGTDCVVSAGEEFALAPSPDSSASAPKYQLTQKKKLAATTCPANGSLPIPASEVDSKTKYYEWTIGAALIPFKYYKFGDKSVAGNTSALGYMGYKWHSPGGDLILGLGAGPATIAVPNGQGQDTQATGFSYAAMFLGQLGYSGTAQFGIAVGRDRVSNSLNWVNAGKGWIGIQIGAKIY